MPENKGSRSQNRVRLAVKHLTAAIAHLNNRAQGCVPIQRGMPSQEVEQLRLIVQALSDIVSALSATQNPPRIGAAGPEGVERRSSAH